MAKDVQPVEITGSYLAESKTQANATGGVVSFSKKIVTLEIYNTDQTNDGQFTVNGITVTVPKGVPFKATYAGVPSTQVMVTGSTSYILNRYE